MILCGWEFRTQMEGSLIGRIRCELRFFYKLRIREKNVPKPNATLHHSVAEVSLTWEDRERNFWPDTCALLLLCLPLMASCHSIQ
jgi:hypothetical protein